MTDLITAHTAQTYLDTMDLNPFTKDALRTIIILTTSSEQMFATLVDANEKLGAALERVVALQSALAETEALEMQHGAVVERLMLEIALLKNTQEGNT